MDERAGGRRQGSDGEDDRPASPAKILRKVLTTEQRAAVIAAFDEASARSPISQVDAFKAGVRIARRSLPATTPPTSRSPRSRC
jgi:hypothetical protein